MRKEQQQQWAYVALRATAAPQPSLETFQAGALAKMPYRLTRTGNAVATPWPPQPLPPRYRG